MCLQILLSLNSSRALSKLEVWTQMCFWIWVTIECLLWFGLALSPEDLQVDDLIPTEKIEATWQYENFLALLQTTSYQFAV